MKSLLTLLVFLVTLSFGQVTSFKAPVKVMADGKSIGESSLNADGSLSPGLFDYDDDGDLDLFIGGFEPPKITYYENIGTPKEPKFTEIGYLKTSAGNDITSNSF